jgi:hypothetical protein
MSHLRLLQLVVERLLCGISSNLHHRTLIAHARVEFEVNKFTKKTLYKYLCSLKYTSLQHIYSYIRPLVHTSLFRHLSTHTKTLLFALLHFTLYFTLLHFTSHFFHSTHTSHLLHYFTLQNGIHCSLFILA